MCDCNEYWRNCGAYADTMLMERRVSTRAGQQGFTLIEMLVSTAIFTVVMIIALGALLAMSESDRRAQTIKAVVNNLNFALDSMSRSIRTGTGYHCGSLAGGDCANIPGSSFYYTDSNGRSTAYRFDNTAGSLICAQTGATGCIERSIDGGNTWAAVTAPEVVITTMSFYLIGSASGDAYQPKLTMEMYGYVQGSAGKKVPFDLQASVTQRVYDQ
jgi:prepilin-type N-terminal cleavage/methylation domain-containing protein